MFYNTEIAIRKQLNYPPFCDIIIFGITSENENYVKKSAELFYKLLKAQQKNINIDIFLPQPAPINKIKNRYRWRIIAKCKLSNSIIDLINATLKKYYDIKQKKANIVVDINPSSMI